MNSRSSAHLKPISRFPRGGRFFIKRSIALTCQAFGKMLQFGRTVNGFIDSLTSSNSMGLPAKRRTKQSKRERASHFALNKTSTIACSHCGQRVRPHEVCRNCGYYRGRQVLKIQGRVERRAARRQKAIAAQKAAQPSSSKEESADKKS